MAAAPGFFPRKTDDLLNICLRLADTASMQCAFLAFFSLIFFLSSNAGLARSSQNWLQTWAPKEQKEYTSVENLFHILRSTRQGAYVLELAQKKTERLHQIVHVGDVSITESTYVRSYSLINAAESVVLRQKIFLGKDLSLADAVVDLAHELTHFALRDVANPYGPWDDRENFIRKGIEGRGGELEAFEQECLVAWELKEAWPEYPTHKLCEKYKKSGHEFARAAAKNDYYAIGTRSWPKPLEKSFPEITNREVLFLSSYAKMAYPLALNKEYDDTLDAVCKNNGKKYQKISSGMSRGLASDDESVRALKLEEIRLKKFHQSHCVSSEEKHS